MEIGVPRGSLRNCSERRGGHAHAAVRDRAEPAGPGRPAVHRHRAGTAAVAVERVGVAAGREDDRRVGLVAVGERGEQEGLPHRGGGAGHPVADRPGPDGGTGVGDGQPLGAEVDPDRPRGVCGPQPAVGHPGRGAVGPGREPDPGPAGSPFEHRQPRLEAELGLRDAGHRRAAGAGERRHRLVDGDDRAVRPAGQVDRRRLGGAVRRGLRQPGQLAPADRHGGDGRRGGPAPGRWPGLPTAGCRLPTEPPVAGPARPGCARWHPRDPRDRQPAEGEAGTHDDAQA